LALRWVEADGPHMLIDDGGDATFLIHEGLKTEREFKVYGSLPEPEKADNPDFKDILTVLRDQLKVDPNY